MKKSEPVHLIKQRRDALLSTLVDAVPFHAYLGIGFERKGDELTGTLSYAPKLIGNQAAERLHGGGTSAFLESTAVLTLAWGQLWDKMEADEISLDDLQAGARPAFPKTINFTMDYLRPGLPRDAYARARINRAGRNFASVHVEAWQDNRAVLFAQATGHFLMPD